MCGPAGGKNPKSRGGIRALDDRARDDETDASRINRDARCVVVPVNATGVFRGASRAEGTRARARSRRARAAGFSSSIPRRWWSSRSETPTARPRRRVGFHRVARARSYTGRTMRRATRASRRRVPNASLAARRAPAGTTPEPAHRGGWANRRRAEPRRRDDTRCAGAGCGRSIPWGGTHHVCYVRLCVLALRGVKLRGVACGAGDVLVFLLSGNPSYVFPQVSRTVVQSEIPQLSN